MNPLSRPSEVVESLSMLLGQCQTSFTSEGEVYVTLRNVGSRERRNC
jgi:hypothetical protein